MAQQIQITCCLICIMDYNSQDRIPIILCLNQHHCCLTCTNQLLENVQISKCPLCSSEINRNQVCRFRLIEQINQIKNQVVLHQKIFQVKEQKWRNSLQECQSKLLKVKKSLQKYADNFFKSKIFEEACQKYQQIIQIDLVYDYEINGLGNKNNEKGYYDNKAYEWYEDQKRQLKIKGNPYDALSLCYSQKMDLYQRGKQWYQKMIIQSPNNYQLIFGLANLECNKGNSEQSKRLYLQVIKLKPGFDKPDQALALICQSQNHYCETLFWMKSTLLKNSQNMFANFIKIKITIPSINLKLKELLQFYKCHQQYSRISNHIGLLYLKQGCKQFSISWFQKSSQINSQFDDPLFNLGQIYKYYQDYNTASLWYKKCCQINPKDEDALQNLGFCHYEQDEQQQALNCYYKCIEINQANDYICNRIGNIYENKEQYGEALQWYRKAFQNNQQEEEYLINMANCCFQLQDYVSAIEYYEEILQYIPNSYQCNSQLQKIYDIFQEKDRQIYYLIKCIETNQEEDLNQYNKLIQIYEEGTLYLQAIYWLQQLIDIQSHNEEKYYLKISDLYKELSAKISQQKRIKE